MFIDLLLNSPMTALVWIVVILLSITVHEFAHAWMAYKKGDRTAEAAGRLTMNPVAHIDPIGIIPLLLLGFGWAKPVPFNPYNLRDPRIDSVHIALAGPASNFILAAVAGIAYRALITTGFVASTSLLPTFLILLVLINLFLLFFNLIPIHPLDGSKLLDAILIKPQHMPLRRAITQYGPRVLFILIILSIMTPLNIFAFISVPAFLTCDALVGDYCSIILSAVL